MSCLGPWPWGPLTDLGGGGPPPSGGNFFVSPWPCEEAWAHVGNDCLFTLSHLSACSHGIIIVYYAGVVGCPQMLKCIPQAPPFARLRDLPRAPTAWGCSGSTSVASIQKNQHPQIQDTRRILTFRSQCSISSLLHVIARTSVFCALLANFENLCRSQLTVKKASDVPTIIPMSCSGRTHEGR